MSSGEDDAVALREKFAKVARIRLSLDEQPVIQAEDVEDLIDFGAMYGYPDEDADMKTGDIEEYESFIRKSQSSMFASNSQSFIMTTSTTGSEDDCDEFRLDTTLDMMMKKRNIRPGDVEEDINPIYRTHSGSKRNISSIETGKSASDDEESEQLHQQSKKASAKLQAFHTSLADTPLRESRRQSILDKKPRITKPRDKGVFNSKSGQFINSSNADDTLSVLNQKATSSAGSSTDFSDDMNSAKTSIVLSSEEDKLPSSTTKQQNEIILDSMRSVKNQISKINSFVSNKRQEHSPFPSPSLSQSPPPQSHSKKQNSPLSQAALERPRAVSSLDTVLTAGSETSGEFSYTSIQERWLSNQREVTKRKEEELQQDSCSSASISTSSRSSTRSNPFRSITGIKKVEIGGGPRRKVKAQRRMNTVEFLPKRSTSKIL